MKQPVFPSDFCWGTATAAFQIEGAHSEDGKGESIWDRFTRLPGKIADGKNGEVACDHYHRYREDLRLMKEIGLNSYRFSVAWPRIFPEGRGQVNQKGVDFYKALLEGLKEHGIRPMLTLYHWDLPQHLQSRGGWANSETTESFVEYAVTLFRELGDLVDFWITFNEPWCISFLGYQTGVHAPGEQDDKSALIAAHNLLLAHGETVKAFRAEGLKSQIGITLNLSPVHPLTASEADRNAALLVDSYHNRWFLDPVFRGEYPAELFSIFCDHFGDFTKGRGGIAVAAQPIDFLGINYYTRQVIANNPKNRFLQAEYIAPEGDYTEMGWEVYPQGIYEILERVDKDYGPLPLYITENGAAFPDKLEGDRVHDSRRIDYLEKHIKMLHHALEKGIPLKGYYIWTLMDNFEWGYGFTKRFGILYTDYENNLRRVWKDSARWLQDFLRQQA